jgi:hypothetical protein
MRDIERGESSPLIAALSRVDAAALRLERHAGSDGRFPMRSRCGRAMPRTISVPLTTAWQQFATWFWKTGWLFWQL